MSKHPTAPSLPGRGSRREVMRVPAPTGGSREQNKPLSRGHCRFLPGHLGPGSARRQPPCPWPGIVPALPEQGHGPEIPRVSIHLQRYQQQPVQTNHFLRGPSLIGFPAPREGKGFLAVILGRRDTGCYSHGRGTDSFVSSPSFGGSEIAGAVFS